MFNFLKELKLCIWKSLNFIKKISKNQIIHIQSSQPTQLENKVFN